MKEAQLREELPATVGTRLGAPVPTLLRLAMLVYVASIPLDAWSVSLEVIGISGSVPQFAGALLGGAFIVCLPRLRVAWPLSLALLAAYPLILMMHGVLSSGSYDEYIRRRVMVVCQLLAFAAIATVVFRERNAIRQALSVLAGSCVFVGMGRALGWPGFQTLDIYQDVSRAAFASWDPNGFAILLGIALLGVANEIREERRPLSAVGVWRFALAGFLVVAIGATGSRGGLGAIAVGVAVWVAAQALHNRRRDAWWAIAVAVVVLGLVVASSGVMAERLQESAVEGRMAGRERIYPEAIQLSLERPWLGWGPMTHLLVLGDRTGVRMRDTHNSILYLATEIGIPATLALVCGIASLAGRMWRRRHDALGPVLLGLAALAVVGNMSVTLLFEKSTWLVLGLLSGFCTSLSLKGTVRPSRVQRSDRARLSSRWRGVPPSHAESAHALTFRVPEGVVAAQGSDRKTKK